MNQLKYIILAASPLTHDIETPVLFPQNLQHASVAHAFAAYGKPVAAGFVSFRSNPQPHPQPTQPICEGVSISLGLASRGRTDAELIECFI
jgi:hypothetical protein